MAVQDMTAYFCRVIDKANFMTTHEVLRRSLPSADFWAFCTQLRHCGEKGAQRIARDAVNIEREKALTRLWTGIGLLAAGPIITYAANNSAINTEPSVYLFLTLIVFGGIGIGLYGLIRALNAAVTRSQCKSFLTIS